MTQGLILWGRPQRLKPLARWPEAAVPDPALQGCAEQALTEQRVVEQPSPSGHLIAVPLCLHAKPCGAVALMLSERGAEGRQAAIRLLQWGLNWLELLLSRKALKAETAPLDPLHRLPLMLLQRLLAAGSCQAAADLLVSELAGQLGCQRVSLGLLQRGQVRVLALSHNINFDQRTQLMRQLSAAMAESLDQNDQLCYPQQGRDGLIRLAHQQLARLQGADWLLTLPLRDGRQAIGALTLERSAPLDSRQLEVVHYLGETVGRLLETRRLAEQSWSGRAWQAGRHWLKGLVGRGGWSRKLALLAVLALLLALAVYQAPYRVTADASIEGEISQVVVAAQEGFIAAAGARAGDRVEQGRLLATLDDRDLQLERLKWLSQREQYLKEYNGALASYDRAQISILKAQMEQAQAQIELIDQQLARSRLLAPIDGFIVEGDLSQSIGAPVERGQVLFEIAPLERYRVVLQVEERDVAAVAVGQSGQLRLASLPDQPLAFRVQRVVPVLTSADGRNYYRVEAELAAELDQLRPGMTGIGKIDIGQRRLGWLWFHRAADSARLWAWSTWQ
ncbi:efflux RND transporter periplasmic adaptor subunit [Marinobacterium arenosum]|uniref:efflux RND transporter periplasmic adaptor subunit n=1 Tax=Marinobacterium arenosum TaxID=2862496 RepID=UPI001C94663A|nr:efflux RND transporter periplasmic adaptor subunit [Marinobacterium arenosum]MBY4677527.1 efflux RND transporter periplasmic adaptor subunit [Marinobacterium arenosum]